ncbi:unnamed protein product [Colias eurytheme]|nr:unnamed protein product [Colias eurytheme]
MREYIAFFPVKSLDGASFKPVTWYRRQRREWWGTKLTTVPASHQKYSHCCVVFQTRVFYVFRAEFFLFGVQRRRGAAAACMAPPARVQPLVCRFEILSQHGQLLKITYQPFGLASAQRMFATVTNWTAEEPRDCGLYLVIYMGNDLRSPEQHVHHIETK